MSTKKKMVVWKTKPEEEPKFHEDIPENVGNIDFDRSTVIVEADQIEDGRVTDQTTTGVYLL